MGLVLLAVCKFPRGPILVGFFAVQCILNALLDQKRVLLSSPFAPSIPTDALTWPAHRSPALLSLWCGLRVSVEYYC